MIINDMFIPRSTTKRLVKAHFMVLFLWSAFPVASKADIATIYAKASCNKKQREFSLVVNTGYSNEEYRAPYKKLGVVGDGGPPRDIFSCNLFNRRTIKVVYLPDADNPHYNQLAIYIFPVIKPTIMPIIGLSSYKYTKILFNINGRTARIELCRSTMTCDVKYVK